MESIGNEHHHRLTLVMGRLNVGDFGTAEILCQQGLALEPSAIVYWNMLATIRARQARYQMAKLALRRVLLQTANDVQALTTFGEVLHFEGNSAAAGEVLGYTLGLSPFDGELALRLGIALAAADQPVPASSAFHRVLALVPAHHGALRCLAALLRRTGQDGAAPWARRAAVLRPEDGDALVEAGLLTLLTGELSSASTFLRAALTIAPSVVDAHYNLSLAALERGDIEKAAWHASLAIHLAPDLARVHTLRGEALQGLGLAGRALRQHKRAVALDPGQAPPLTKLGRCLLERGCFSAAATGWRRAVTIAPHDPGSRFQASLALLQSGLMEEGWREYEYRKERGVLSRHRRIFTVPEWRGDTLNGRTVLIHAEQGFGDMIQFARFLPALAERAPSMVVEIYPPLSRLFQQSFPFATIVPSGRPPPPHDVHLPLMSAARVLGTSMSTLPVSVPYLDVGQDMRARWESTIRTDERLTIGIVWSGNIKIGRHRTVPPKSLIASLSRPEIHLFSLQKQITPGEAACLSVAGVTSLGDQLTDFAETAAALSALDLVVSIDTAVAHLAGALGRSSWILLPPGADWRWLRNRDDSPWYPTVRLFRRAANETWGPTFGRLSSALDHHLASTRSH